MATIPNTIPALNLHREAKSSAMHSQEKKGVISGYANLCFTAQVTAQNTGQNLPDATTTHQQSTTKMLKETNNNNIH